MSIKKKYQTLVSVEYTTSILVKGKETWITFRGGKLYPTRENGYIRTSDPELIEALDSDKRFGKEWICVEVRNDEAPKVKESGEIVEDQKTKVSGVINSQQARDWLNKNKGVSYSKMRNKSEVLSIAKELKVEFLNIN